MFILKASREEPYEILDVLIEYFAKFCHREKNPLLNSFCSNIFWQLTKISNEYSFTTTNTCMNLSQQFRCLLDDTKEHNQIIEF